MLPANESCEELSLCDLAQYIYDTISNPERKIPIWVLVSGVCIVGIVVSPQEYNWQANKTFLTIRFERGDNLSRPEFVELQSEFKSETTQKTKFDSECIYFSDAVIYIDGFSFNSWVAVRLAHVDAWGLGIPKITRSFGKIVDEIPAPAG